VKSGARLVCWDMNKRDNDEVVQSLKKQGALAYGYELDISDRSQVETVADMVWNTCACKLTARNGYDQGAEKCNQSVFQI
jgi:hypothetical protein